ncbi:hypothetical protein M422DRAFT_245185 [Sphaerobolus stellatus SS14]|nr:hypothetical protein M422DRAFT_245185 [Sphaerobolus stellatus SS14]
MSHRCGRRMWAEELSMQAVEGNESIPGLTAGDLMDPPSTSVDPNRALRCSPRSTRMNHVCKHMVPRLYQGLNPSRLAGALGTANQGLDSTRRVAIALGTATQGPYSPCGPDHVSPDEGDMDEEENFTIPASEVNILCQEYAEFINLKDNAEIVLSEAMEATEHLNTVFNRIRTSMNRMSPHMKELFVVPATKSSGKTIEPGNNRAHDKAAAKAASEQIIAQTAINTPVPGTGTDDHVRLRQSRVPCDGDRNSLPPRQPNIRENIHCTAHSEQSDDSQPWCGRDAHTKCV